MNDIEPKLVFSPEGSPQSPVGISGGNLVLRGRLTNEYSVRLPTLDFKRLVLDYGSWPDLRSIRGSRIESILIRGDDIDWESIASLEHLVALEIDSSSRTSIDECLLGRLRYLSLPWSASGANSLGTSASLKALEVRGSIPSLECLSGLSSLESISIAQSAKISSLKGIDKLDRLSFAEFTKCSKLADVSEISSCAQLSCLNLTACKRVEDVSAVSASSSLREILLQIGEVATLSTFRGSLVEKLRFDCKIADGNLDFLFEMPRLKFCLFKGAKNMNRKLKDVQSFLERKGYVQEELRSSLRRFPSPRDFWR